MKAKVFFELVFTNVRLAFLGGLSPKRLRQAKLREAAYVKIMPNEVV